RNKPFPVAQNASQFRKMAVPGGADRRSALSVHTVSLSPEARDEAPAPADQGREPSPFLGAVSRIGSSGTGTKSGHSKPSATARSRLRSCATAVTNSAGSDPVRVVPAAGAAPRAQ